MDLDLDRLVARYRGPLVGLMAGWGVPWGEAVDLAQDVFAEAFLARERFRGDARRPEDVGPWLRGIARNLHRAWLRRAGARAEPLPGEVAEPRGAGDGRGAELRAALARLPESLRTPLCMHYLERTSVREVAGLLGVGEKTVEGRLYRGRAALRALLDPDPQGAGGRKP